MTFPRFLHLTVIFAAALGWSVGSAYAASETPQPASAKQKELQRKIDEWNANYARSIPKQFQPPAAYKPSRVPKFLDGVTILSDGKKATLIPALALLLPGNSPKIKKLTKMPANMRIVDFSEFAAEHPAEFTLYTVRWTTDGSLPIVRSRDVPNDGHRIAIAILEDLKVPIAVNLDGKIPPFPKRKWQGA